MKHIALDLTGLMDKALGASGILESDLDELASSAKSSYEDNAARRESGEIGFWDLPDDRALAQAAMDYATSVPDHIDTVVLLGIGGSSLGPHALYSALAKPYDQLRDRSPGMPRRLFFPDNPDPQSFQALLKLLPLKSTLFNVVTKSGGTAETVAQLLVVAERIEKELGAEALKTHLVVTTDPEKGALRRVATELGLTCFPVPANVGGRFSVLSGVGLLPGALAGLDVVGLLEGAASVRDAVMGAQSSSRVWARPSRAAAKTATWGLHPLLRAGRPISTPSCSSMPRALTIRATSS
jgi:glucose-6-phosphate isomerase